MSNCQIKDLSTNAHFSLIPNIIYEIGLKANQIAVYGAIKRIAGENSNSTKSMAKIAKYAGVCRKTIFGIIQSLCEVNTILKKPLLSCLERHSESGDRDTNLIEVINIWPENLEFFQKSYGGSVKFTPPSVNSTPGVVQNLHYGSVNFTPLMIEEPIKKNSLKKTTTTPTPSESKNVHKSSSSFLKEKEDAKALKDYIDKRSERYSEKWNLDLSSLERQIGKYGSAYVTDQINYMLERQQKYQKNINRRENKIKPLDDTKVYFNLACEYNYAKSEYKTKGEF